jgi:hypothetical protein
MRPRWAIAVGAFLTGMVLALAPTDATADDPPATCGGWDVEYNLSARLELDDTPMGEGDGVYTIGPGHAVLRFEDRDGQPGGTVNMISYSMREHFVIKSKTLFWTTTVTTDTKTRATPDVCSSAAEGTLTDHTLVWKTPVRGYRTDGTLECDGSLCGKFGAPPPGKTELHIGPGPVPFRSFDFAADRTTFAMAKTQVSKTEMPKQTGFLALAGRETKRTCVQAKPCAAGARR